MAPRWVVGVEVALELVVHVVIGLAVVEANVGAESGFAGVTKIRDHTNAKVQSMQHVVRTSIGSCRVRACLVTPGTEGAHQRIY